MLQTHLAPVLHPGRLQDVCCTLEYLRDPSLSGSVYKYYTTAIFLMGSQHFVCKNEPFAFAVWSCGFFPAGGSADQQT